jgi:hypothetical protein
MATKKAKVLIDFIQVEPSKKVEQSQVKFDKISKAVGTFDTPDLDMMVYEKDIANADNLIKLVDGGDHSLIEERDTAIRLLDADNRMLAAYVTRKANGNEVIIQLAGFTSTVTVTVKAKEPEQAILQGGPGKLIGGLALEATILEFAARYTFVVGQDLSNVTFDKGNVIVNPAPTVAAGETAPIVYPVVIRTTKSNKAVINNLDTRKDFQCICFGTSTAGSGKESEMIIAKSL